MKMPTQAQINTGLRYGGICVTAGASALVTLGAIPPDKAHALVDALQGVLTDLQDMVGRFYVIAGIVGPGLALWIAKLGWNSARPANQTASAIAADPKGVIAAVQAIPEAQVTVSDPKLVSPGVTLAPPK